MEDRPNQVNDPRGCLLVRLRTDINHWLQQSGGIPYYLIEDPISARYFRVGVREWKLASRLDGQTTLAAVMASWRSQPGNDCLSDAEAVAFCRWLVSVQLATIEARGPAGIRFPAAPPAKEPAAAVWKNPFFIRIPLLNPDERLETLLPWLRWMLGGAFFLAWLLFCGTATYQVLAHGQRFMAATSAVLAPQNWLYLLLVWIGLKVIHETFHGLVCKKFGGTIPCAGVVLILFSPVAFVDVTSSWRFGSKWQRIYTAAAGMYIEFAIAALAAIVWSLTSAGLLNQICHNVVVTASLTTLLFNANPLMRFDGYYILTDLLEVQNLYASGRQYLRYFFRRYFFGVSASLPAWPRAKRILIMCYAWASCFWRLMVSVSMAAVAATLFSGAGLILSVMAAVMWFGLPTARLIRYLAWGDANGRPQLWRFLLASMATAGLAAVLLFLPWPGGVTAPGVVEYSPLEVIRTSTAGFVREIHVKPGQLVRQGEVLAVLANEETERKLDDLKLEIEQSRIKSRILHRSEDMAKYQVEIEKGQALAKHMEQLEKEVRELTARAPRAGRVIGRDLDSLVGQYLEAGKWLMAIGVEENKEVRLSVGEERVETFGHAIGSLPRLRIRGRPRAIATAPLAKIEPRAGVKVEYPALAAPHGGPLAVRSAPHTEPGKESTEVEWEYVNPRFTAIVRLPATTARGLRAGELVQARLSDGDDTVGRRLYQTIRRWLTAKLRRGTQ